jgi:AcrR family transcriptional regulator
MGGQRGGTRLRIRSVALELFSEQGYERTSLREIAERLGVTKAALYYHFRSKEDIVASLFDDLIAEIDELVGWAERQPSTPELRAEILDRYLAIMRSTGRELMRFHQENQPAIRDLKPSTVMRERFRTLADLICAPDATPVERLRARIALVTVNVSDLLVRDLDLTDEERESAIDHVVRELLTPPAGRGPAS